MHFDLVEQISTTTGTGAYSFTSTPAGRRSFAGAVTDGAVVSYVATDDAGGFEIGIGTWSSGGATLARTKVLVSSNSNNAVSWTAGSRRVYLTPHSEAIGFVGGVRHRMDLPSSAPSTSDDNTLGYGPGSLWIKNDTGSGDFGVYLCRTAGTGTALWTRLAVVANYGTDSALLFLSADAIFQGNGSIALARCYNQNANGISVGGHESAASNYYADGYVGLTLAAHTSDATPANLGPRTVYTANNVLYVENDGVLLFEALVTASSGTDRKTWKVQASASADSSGTVTIDDVTVTEVFATAGASAWALAVVSPDVNDVTLEATGAAATTIAWSAVITAAASANY